MSQRVNVVLVYVCMLCEKKLAKILCSLYPCVLPIVFLPIACVAVRVALCWRFDIDFCSAVPRGRRFQVRSWCEAGALSILGRLGVLAELGFFADCVAYVH